MSLSNIINDLYNFDELPEPIQPELKKHTMSLNNEVVKGYTFNYNNKTFFVFRANSKYNEHGQHWGNPWNVYSLDDNKHILIGRKTREKAIEDTLNREN